jgi:ubiquinone/menaquinone biosynthesis C-methylase UbiE
VTNEGKITSETVRADFNSLMAVIHYTRAAYSLGLWESERILIERFFPLRTERLLEAGCGAGRVTLGLWRLGYRDLSAFDFAEGPLEQAQILAKERGADAIRFIRADATRLAGLDGELNPPFGGALFMFNGLMQIPGRENRRNALRELRRVCRTGASILFTTHDRNGSPAESAHWRLEAELWERGGQDPHLAEFGDRYFTSESGRTFMHVPDRAEILADLAESGWAQTFDAMRREIAAESPAVWEFADECRFWHATASAESGKPPLR